MGRLTARRFGFSIQQQHVVLVVVVVVVVVLFNLSAPL